MPENSRTSLAKSGTVIEFLGLPGSGKSVLSHRLVEMLSSKTVPVTEPTYSLVHESSSFVRGIVKSSHVVKEVLFHPLHMYSSLTTILASKQEFLTDAIGNFSNWLFISSLLRRQRRLNNNVMVLDQGIFQAIWSVLLTAENRGISDLYQNALSLIRTTWIIVVVEASLNTLERRLSKRERNPGILARNPQSLDSKRALSLFELTKESVRALAGSHQKVRVISVNSDLDEDLEKNAAKLAKDVGGF